MLKMISKKHFLSVSAVLFTLEIVYSVPTEFKHSPKDAEMSENQLLDDSIYERTTTSDFSATEEIIPEYLLPNITEEPYIFDNISDAVQAPSDGSLLVIEEVVEIAEEAAETIAETVEQVMEVIMAPNQQGSLKIVQEVADIIKDLSGGVIEVAGIIAKVPYSHNLHGENRLGVGNNTHWNTIENDANFGRKGEKVIEVAQVIGETIKSITGTVGKTIETIVRNDSKQIISNVHVVEDVIQDITDGTIDIVELFAKGISALSWHRNRHH